MLSEKNIVRWQLWAAAAYLALLPSNAWTFARSLTFGIAAALAAVIVVAGVAGRGARVASLGVVIPALLLLWCAWSVASLGWSADFDYSATQVKREIGWSLLAILAFYVAPHSARAWRTI